MWFSLYHLCMFLVKNFNKVGCFFATIFHSLTRLSLLLFSNTILCQSKRPDFIFLINLLEVLERHDNITQYDKDSFNLKCARFFDKFTDFVAEHYAFSKRNDTPYWKDIRSKSFLKLAKSDSIFKDMIVRYDIINQNDYFNSVFGEHYITTGMNLLTIYQI